MTILEKIKSKVIRIDINELIERLKLELKIKEKSETEETENTDSKTNAQTLLEYALYDTLLIILDITHLKKIDESLYSIWVNMIKDYWYMNKYNKLINSSEDENSEDDDLEVSSIKEGDTQVSFSSNSSTININGTRYSVGTIDFDENILREKYEEDLYRHRRMRW